MITYSQYEQNAIKVALTAIQQTLVTDNVLSSVVQVENYLKLQLADEPDEWFGVMFLTSQHRLIHFDKLFRGTVNASYVHIRVIARKALELNAAAVILALGADCTMLGRSYIYALASQGQQGVEHLLDLYEKEICVAMTLTGAKTISEIGNHSITRIK
jgi:hypothetical protein